MEKRKLPIDFSELTEEDIQEASKYKTLKESTVLDFLQALVDSEDPQNK